MKWLTALAALLLAIPAMSQTASIDLTKGASGFWPSHRGRVDFQFSKEHGGIFIQGSTGKANHFQLDYAAPIPIKDEYSVIHVKAVFQVELGNPAQIQADIRLKDRYGQLTLFRPHKKTLEGTTLTHEYEIVPGPCKPVWAGNQKFHNDVMDLPFIIYAMGIGYRQKVNMDYQFTVKSVTATIVKQGTEIARRPLWTFNDSFHVRNHGGFQTFLANNALIVNKDRTDPAHLEHATRSKLLTFSEIPVAIEFDAELLSGSAEIVWRIYGSDKKRFQTAPVTIAGKRKTYKALIPNGSVAPPFYVDRMLLTANNGAKAFNLALFDSAVVVKANAAEALAFDIHTGNPIHVLKTRENIAFHYSFTNTSDNDAAFNAKVTLTSFNGTNIAESFDIKAKAGETVKIYPQNLPTENGYWDVEAKIIHTGNKDFSVQRKHFVKMTPAGPNTIHNPEFKFGVCSHPGRWSQRDQKLEAFTAALCGLKYLRGLGLSWGGVQKTPDAWNTKHLHRRIEDYDMFHIECQGHLGFHPQWAAPEETQKKHWKIWTRCYPEKTELYQQFVERIAREFRGKITIWETINEPDLSGKPQGQFTATQLAQFQKLTYEPLKRGNPQALLATAGFAAGRQHAALFDKDYMETALREGKGFYEVYLTHNHGAFNQYVDEIDNHIFKIRNRQNIKNIPWFPNETAIPSTFNSERNQAFTLYKKLIFSWGRGGVGYVWYDLRNDGFDKTDSEHHFGLVTNDFYPKPVYAVYNHITRTFGAASCKGQVETSPGVWAFHFQDDHDKLIALWNQTEVPALLAFRTDAKSAVAIDVMDNESPLPIHNGIVIVQAEKEPCSIRLKDASTLQFLGPLVQLESLEVAVPGRPLNCTLKVFNPYDDELPFTLTALTLPPHFSVKQKTLAQNIPPKQSKNIAFVLQTPDKANAPKSLASFRLRCQAGKQTTEFNVPINPAILMQGLATKTPDFVLDNNTLVFSRAEADPAIKHRLWKGPHDQSVKLYLGRDDKNLIIKADVTDDIHCQPYRDFTVWQGDNVQACFKFPTQTDAWEIGASLLDDGTTQAFVFLAPASADKDDVAKQINVQATRKDTLTSYTIAIPLAAIQATLADLQNGFRFNLLVNENDGEGRDGWIHIAPGIGENKNPDKYPFVLMD